MTTTSSSGLIVTSIAAVAPAVVLGRAPFRLDVVGLDTRDLGVVRVTHGGGGGDDTAPRRRPQHLQQQQLPTMKDRLVDGRWTQQRGAAAHIARTRTHSAHWRGGQTASCCTPAQRRVTQPSGAPVTFLGRDPSPLI